MTVSTLKDLEKLIKLCRKTGVFSIKVDGIDLELSPLPTAPTKRVYSQEPDLDENIRIPMPNIQRPDQIQTNSLTEEQLLYYSANPETPGEA